MDTLGQPTNVHVRLTSGTPARQHQGPAQEMRGLTTLYLTLAEIFSFCPPSYRFALQEKVYSAKSPSERIQHVPSRSGAIPYGLPSADVGVVEQPHPAGNLHWIYHLDPKIHSPDTDRMPGSV
jgi:hypothetical protein